MKKGIIYILFVSLWMVSCDGYNKLLKSKDYEKKLERAKIYYDKGNFVKANTLFEELVPVYKGTEKAEEIYYLFSYCNYYQGDYALAQYHFKNYYRNFPSGKHAEECLFMNAYCYYLNSPNYTLDQTDTKNAMAELQNFIDQFPESSRIDSCNKISDLLRAKLEHKEYDITKQYFNISDYKAAITSGKNYMKEFPESKAIDEMYYIIINSYYLLAVNSLETKKIERLNLAIDFYKKFVDLYANSSSYAGKAENVYQSCLKLKSNIIKQ
ncbi:MAG: outer membrane protein assembly factor BamD [Bacteroidetes bacterium]|nr:outer membrane protein assembly factor BamD [Bacteroidota bacterium]